MPPAWKSRVLTNGLPGNSLLKKKNLIDFWLLWIFVASQAFSSSVKQGLPSSCSAGFSLQ